MGILLSAVALALLCAAWAAFQLWMRREGCDQPGGCGACGCGRARGPEDEARG